MTHATPEALAAQTDEAVGHAASCVACARLLDEQRAMSRVLGGLPAPALRPSRKEAMAAELMARADALPAAETAPRRAWLAVAGVFAAAVAMVIALAPPRGAGPDVPSPPSPVASAPSSARVVQREAPPPAVVELEAQAQVSGPGSFTRTGRVIALESGDITVDARDAAPARIVRGDTAIAVAGAKVQVTARRGVIAQVAVFAGSAEVTVGGARIVVEQGVTWTRPARAATAAPEPDAAARSLAAFRAGWEKLRAGDHAGAIAELDRATDEVVAEDAMYWAAVAAERLGRADARVRFERFLAAFPRSPRVDAATAALARLPAR